MASYSITSGFVFSCMVYSAFQLDNKHVCVLSLNTDLTKNRRPGPSLETAIFFENISGDFEK